MRILVDARPLVDATGGGVPRVAKGLLPALVAAMPETKFVFATTGFHPARYQLPATSRQIQTPLPNKLWSLLCLLRLSSFDQLAKGKADLLLLPNLGFVGRPKIPYALIVHDLSFLIEPRWFSWKSRLWHHAVRAKNLIRGAKHLFAVSETTKRDLINLLTIDPNRITVIPMGLTHIQATSYQLPDTLLNRRYLVAFGANDTRKNATCAVAAVEELRRDPRFADTRLVLTGGRMNDAKRFPAFCLLLAHPDDSALALLLQHASAFLYPSWYEGFGLPLHEAAFFGTPCIASTAGALTETAPHGTLFAPPAKPHLWTSAMKKIFEDPHLHRTSTALGDWTTAAELIAERLRHL